MSSIEVKGLRLTERKFMRTVITTTYRSIADWCLYGIHPTEEYCKVVALDWKPRNLKLHPTTRSALDHLIEESMRILGDLDNSGSPEIHKKINTDKMEIAVRATLEAIDPDKYAD